MENPIKWMIWGYQHFRKPPNRVVNMKKMVWNPFFGPPVNWLMSETPGKLECLRFHHPDIHPEDSHRTWKWWLGRWFSFSRVCIPRFHVNFPGCSYWFLPPFLSDSEVRHVSTFPSDWCHWPKPWVSRCEFEQICPQGTTRTQKDERIIYLPTSDFSTSEFHRFGFHIFTHWRIISIFQPVIFGKHVSLRRGVASKMKNDLRQKWSWNISPAIPLPCIVLAWPLTNHHFFRSGPPSTFITV